MELVIRTLRIHINRINLDIELTKRIIKKYEKLKENEMVIKKRKKILEKQERCLKQFITAEKLLKENL